MSSRLKAAAAALQPESLDLTQYAPARSVSRERSTLRMRAEDAAGAMAYAAMDAEVNGEVVRGDPLPGLLLRLKYADQGAKRAFQRAHLILLRRHGWNPKTHLSEIMFAVAYATIFEWVHDACQKCRGARVGQAKARACPTCGPRFARDEYGKRTEIPRSHVLPVRGKKGKWKGQWLPARLVGADPACLKCNGLGRVFRVLPDPKGMKCASCGNTGRRRFSVKNRWLIVEDCLVTAKAMRGERGPGLSLEIFRHHWMNRYNKLLEVLRATDRNIVAGLAFGMERADNHATVPECLDFLTEETTEGETAEDEPGS